MNKLELIVERVNSAPIDKTLRDDLLTILNGIDKIKDSLGDLTGLRMFLPGFINECHETLNTESISNYENVVHYLNSDYANERHEEAQTFFEELDKEVPIAAINVAGVVSNVDLAQEIFESTDYFNKHDIVFEGASGWDTENGEDEVSLKKIVFYTNKGEEGDSKKLTFAVVFSKIGLYKYSYVLFHDNGADVYIGVDKRYQDKEISSTTVDYLKSVLANDEAASDAELLDFFINEEGLSARQAKAWVECRNSYLKDPIGNGDTPSQFYAKAIIN